MGQGTREDPWTLTTPSGGSEDQARCDEAAWARAADNPVGGWYGLKKGLRDRFAHYVSPAMAVLGLAEVEHLPRNNRMRSR
jgi:hypothetical protein